MWFVIALQISRFRQLSDTQDGALVDNFRTLQPVGNRRIFARTGHVRHTSIAALKHEGDYLKYDWFYWVAKLCGCSVCHATLD